MKNENKLPQLSLEAPNRWKDYELLDSGQGQTLERVGKYILIRLEPQAIWSKSLPESEWKKADAEMIPTGGEAGGYWNYRREVKQPWWVDYHGLQAEIRLAKSRHIGIFPEQASQWDWIEEQIKSAGRPVRVINLFGYTGMATAAAARAGAEVTHVDASKHAVAWASRNLQHSGLAKAPVRWLVEDARKYLRREAKRQSYYDGIILDPPKFGRGPDGKVWSYFEDIVDLFDLCRKVLTRTPRFICLTSYAIQASALVPHQALEEMIAPFGGRVTSGELVTIEKSKGRVLSHSLYSRWTSE